MNLHNSIAHYLSAINWKSSAVLISALVLTIGAAIISERASEALLKKEYSFVCEEIKTKIVARLNSHSQVLRGGSALFAASDDVTRNEWKIFYAHQDLDNHFKGIQGLGFSLIIPKNQLEQHIKNIQNEGFPNYTVKPSGDRDIYTSIIYLEPFSGRNLRAFGYDMYSEPIRRKAMEIARDSNHESITEKVILVQETNEDVQAGTLMYLPVYDNHKPTTTVEERRDAIIGWVYSPFRMNDLMNDIIEDLDSTDAGQIHLQIYDKDIISEKSLLFDSRPKDTIDHINLTSRNLVTPVEFHGTKWLLYFTQAEKEDSFFNSRGVLIIISGTVISFLLFGLYLTLRRTNIKALEIAEELTAELLKTHESMRRISNEQSIILDNAPFGISRGIDREQVWINSAMTNIFGYSKEEFIGQTTRKLFTSDEDFNKFGVDAYTELAKGGSYETVQELITKDGTHKFIRYVGQAVETNDLSQGVIWLLEDITARKQIEESLVNSEFKLKQAQKISKLGNWEWDIVTDQVVLSEEIYTLFGFNMENFGGTYADLIEKTVHPEDKELIRKTGELALQTGIGQTVEYRIIRPDGNLRWVRAIGELDYQNGKLIRMHGTNQDITEQKQTESALHESEIKFRTIADHTYDWEYWQDPDGRIIYMSPSCERVSGYKAEEFVSDSSLLKKIIHPEDYELMTEHYDKIHSMGHLNEIEKLEFRITKKDGSEACISHVCLPIFDDSGKYMGRRVSNRDITERKLAELELEENRAKYHGLSEAAFESIFLSEKGVCIEQNRTAEITFGYSNEEALGRYGTEWIVPEDREFVMKHMLERFEESYEAHAIKKDGTTFPCMLRGKTMFYKGRIVRVTSLTDITRQKEAENAFHDNETKFRTVADFTYDWEYWEDADGPIVYMSPSCERISGYKAEEFIEEPLLLQKIVYPEDADMVRKHNERNNSISRESGVSEIDYRIVRKDGIVVDIGHISTHVFNVDGEYSGRRISNRDITERKIIEKALNEAKNEAENAQNLAEQAKTMAEAAKNAAEEANFAKSDFLSRMSHELRTPMNSILGFAQLMDMSDIDASHKKGVRHILNSGHHLLTLINEVLEISRIEAGKISYSIEPIRADDTILDTIAIVSMIAEERKVKLEVENSDIGIMVKADNKILKQILLNLITNAIKYNRIGGSVCIKTEIVREDFVKIMITDTGFGISEENIQMLFQPFQRIGAERSEVEGTGLGLVVAKKLIETIGGQIGVESVVDKGSTFWIELPLCTSTISQLLETIEKDESLDEKKSRGTLLYVEDNVSNIELVVQILESHRPGIHIITTKFGGEAVKMAIQYTPLLILLDLDLPDLHGREVLIDLKANALTKNIPVVILSADAMPKQIDNVMKEGASKYLTKPLNVVLFLQTLDEWYSK